MMWCLHHTVSICMSWVLCSLPIKCHEKLFKLPKNVVLMILLWEGINIHTSRIKIRFVASTFVSLHNNMSLFSEFQASQQIEGCCLLTWAHHEYTGIQQVEREQKYIQIVNKPNCHEKWVHHILPGVIITKYGDDQNGYYLLICVKFAISKIFRVRYFWYYLVWSKHTDRKSLNDQRRIKLVISSYKMAFYEVRDEQTWFSMTEAKD